MARCGAAVNQGVVQVGHCFAIGYGLANAILIKGDSGLHKSSALPTSFSLKFERRRSFKNQSVRGRVNGVLVFQSDQRGVLMVSVGCWGPILGVQALKGPGC